MQLDDITIGITSFLRPGYLQGAINGIRKNFPDAKFNIADDSDFPVLGNFNVGTRLIKLPFDSGIGAKRNLSVADTKTKYWLAGTDDFDFTLEARWGVERMREVLERNPHVDVAAGRFNRNRYEGHIRYVPGEYIQEISLPDNSVPFTQHPLSYRVDLTANYFLARTDKIAPWSEEMQIGGEHIMWFLKMRELDRVIVWVPGADILQQTWTADVQDPRYNLMRARCWNGHRKMKELMNIKKYIGFDGEES